MAEARLSQQQQQQQQQFDQWPYKRSHVRADQRLSLLLCTHRNMSQVVGSVLLLVSFLTV